MSSEYFKGTSLYLVRLKTFEWIKCLRRHLHQIQGNGACRNFVTKSRVNLRLITPCKNAHRDESEIYNFQRFNLISNNKYITGSWEVRLTWLDCSQRSYIQFFGWTLREDVRLARSQTPELFFDLLVPFQLSAKEQKNNLCKCIPEHD